MFRVELVFRFVLIVPSGIETCFTDFPVSFLIVLIVPSGIETFLRLGRNRLFNTVLIVPSGIETSLSSFAPSVSTRINCT